MVFPKTRKPRSDSVWTYKQFLEECDTPGSNVVVVLCPNDLKGFRMFARNNTCPREVHPIWDGAKQLWFRTIEQAMTVLADVPHLNQHVEIEISKWRQATGPY